MSTGNPVCADNLCPANRKLERKNKVPVLSEGEVCEMSIVEEQMTRMHRMGISPHHMMAEPTRSFSIPRNRER